MDEQKNESILDKNKILDYIDITTLKEILDAFTTTTNLMANIVDTEGRSIFSKNDVKKCSKFCRIIYGLENGVNRCQSAYKRAGKQAALFNKPYIFRCPSGLIEWAAPIKVNNEHIGTIICGQILMWEPEEFFWIELREMNKDITSDFQKLFKAVDELPVISGPQVQAAAYLLYVVANYIMEAGWKNYDQAKEFTNLSSAYYAEIENRKHEKQPDHETSEYSLIDENEIMVKLQGKEKKAKEYLQTVIAKFRYESDNNLVIMRSKMVELLVILWRITNRMGMDHVYFSDINNKYLPQIFQITSIDHLSELMLEAVDDYVLGINKNSDESLGTSINAMMQYIEMNYAHDLSLEEITEAACLSPSYAGRIFKENTGMSIMTCVLKIRVKKAKKFLINPHYQIEEIAKNVGYSDASYFTKVFKKFEGITPTEFRKYNNINKK